MQENLFPFAMVLLNNEQGCAAFKILGVTDWKLVSSVKNNFYKVPCLFVEKFVKKDII